MSERVVKINKTTRMTGDMQLNASELVEMFKKFVGCQKVNFLPELPEEGTGHIDMWMKLVSNKKVLINQISDETILKAKDFVKTNENPMANDVILELIDWSIKMQAHLESATEWFVKNGFEAVRIPMPLPSRIAVKTFANSLIVNSNVLMPIYKKNPFIADHELYDDYEKKAETVYNSLGYKVIKVESDLLISDGGSIHCGTMQVPKN